MPRHGLIASDLVVTQVTQPRAQALLTYAERILLKGSTTQVTSQKSGIAAARWGRRAGAAVLFALLGAVSSAAAQEGRALAQRAELERLADSLAQHNSGQAAAIRQRLSEGDFRPGDKIQLRVLSDSAYSGTLTVRPDRTVVLPDIPPISVAGLLRSEIEPHLSTQLARYLRNPVVQASSLIRVSVIGEAVRPGFYEVSPESPLSEIITAAGGLAGNGDAYRSEIRRGNATLYNRDQLREMLAQGRSLDQVDLRSGDQFVAGRRRGGFNDTVTVLATLSGVVLAVVAVAAVF